MTLIKNSLIDSGSTGGGSGGGSSSSSETPSSIKSKYESNANTNAFTDADKSKLAGIEDNAQVNTVNSITAGSNVTVTDDGAGNLEIASSASGGSGGSSYNGVTSLISTKATTGTWTITGLVVGKPVYVFGEVDAVQGFLQIELQSGWSHNKVPMTSAYTLRSYNDTTHSTLPTAVLVPSSTTAIIEVSKMDATVVAQAYQ